jgi:dTDP-4-dehydrorhamnose reductase
VGGTVLVVGAGGFLGANITLGAIDDSDAEVLAHFRSAPQGLGIPVVSADLSVPGVAGGLVRDVRPTMVINCAALADVDACEHDPRLSGWMNADMPVELATACVEVGCDLVHVSTDAVFGAAPGPYRPESHCGPLNQYGRDKAAGERGVLGVMPSAVVARTNIVGWSPSGTRSLLEFFWNKLSTGQEVGGFVDAEFRPVSASDAWPLLKYLVGQGASGVVHMVGEQLLSKFEFGLRVAATFGFDSSLVRPVHVAQAQLAAPRSSRLDLVPMSHPASIADLLDIDSALQRLRALDHDGYRRRLRTLTAAEVQ